jgi:LruC domain-containing protein
VETSNSSGYIRPGDKVKLGRFPAGKTIGFAMVVNGWRGGPSVTAGAMVVYTQKEFNPETNPSLKQHTVLLHDAVSNRFIYGFEDTRRDGGADNDFNDCVFYTSCNPVTGIDPSNCLPAKKAIDTDLDGVFDEFDEYPTDPQRAYNNMGVVSTLAFEDLWPSLGDYDFNDMVVGYQINRVTNASNQVKDIRAKFWVNATGAGFSNGFGIELPVAPNTIKSVTGTKLTSNYIRNAANGTEQGQSKATIIVFDDANSLLPRNGSAFVNTDKTKAKVKSDTLNVTIEFTNTVSNTTLGNAPYNPFLIQNKKREVEIHLPDMKPTSLANKALLSTGADKSDIARSVYYKTSRLLPWAINIPAAFNHPIEKSKISEAYLKFISWASSGGTQFTDWYVSRSGYRNNNLIF